jgi:hypothetical protein
MRPLVQYGQIQPNGSFTHETDGSYAFTMALQASRRGNDQDGRRYTITVSATKSSMIRHRACSSVGYSW